MNNSVISAKGLVKKYGQGSTLVKALRGVDLDIPRGSFTCIIGPSGHGKSTLMHLLGGLDHPTGGSVLIDGQEVSKLDNKELAGQGHLTTAEDKVAVVCKEPRPQICTQDYRPVCALLQDDSSKTYSNGCNACSDPEVTGYREGACE